MKIEAQLKAEVQEMLALAEAADRSAIPDGVSLPDEIKRLEDHLAAIARAKAAIETRAKARDEREYARYSRSRRLRNRARASSRGGVWRKSNPKLKHLRPFCGNALKL